MNDFTLLTARQAAERLGVKLETLYAYVSRGRLRSLAVPGSRARRYSPEDVDALRSPRGLGVAADGTAAEPAMPVVASSISLIEAGRLYYRGRDVLRLSDSATLEEIAKLLWDEPDAASVSAPRRLVAPGSGASLSRGGRGTGPPANLLERCQMRLAEMAAADRRAPDLSRTAVARVGWGILWELTGLAGGSRRCSEPVHRRLARGWRLDETGGDILRRSMVLLADHELNTATFVARCVASAGASPYAVITAAIGALSGRRGSSALDAAMRFQQLAQNGDPMIAAAELLTRGEALPGIGHPLYPEGDPRAVAILYAISALTPSARRFVGWRPNVDFALAVATTALGLPPEAALALFLIARTVGWVAHAIEQYESDIPLRPRARYVGPRPEQTPV